MRTQHTSAIVAAIAGASAIACTVQDSPTQPDPQARDRIQLKDAAEPIACTIVRQEPEQIVAIFENGLMAFRRSWVWSIDDADDPVIERDGTKRLPDWRETMLALGAKSWAKGLQQIPATVIDTGVLMHVPYKSHRCGEYEVNVYGDPAAPAGIEIGVHGSLLSDVKAHEHCRDFIVELLNDETDRAVVRLLRDEPDIITRQDLTFEITPPTAPDSYDGWWISVYDSKAIDSVRASTQDLDRVTVKVPDHREAALAPPKEPESRDKARLTLDWSDDDYSRARKPSVSTPSSGSGRVYVRGYYRKDGTYVRPHTRGRPR